jgi:pimeloyl-ACP methyl ester carboxylesterase
MTTQPAEPVCRTLTSQGLKLNYVDWGNEGAPLLLLIHGMRDHARSWDWTARALRDRWHVVAPDLRGHGDSQWSPDGAYLSPFHVLDIVDLIETLGREQVTIIGHSYGGNVSARYAAIFPQRVRKLVLVDGLGASVEVLAKWTEYGQVERTRDWIEKRRETAARKPRRFGTLEEAVRRMAAANQHLSEDQARHLAVHGIPITARAGYASVSADVFATVMSGAAVLGARRSRIQNRQAAPPAKVSAVITNKAGA